MTTSARHLVAAVLAVLSLAASVVLVLVALDVASGETLRPGPTEDCCNTEYIDMTVYAFTAALALLLAVAAAYSVWIAVAGTLGVFAVEWWSIHEANQRLAAAGWSDGLEVLAFLLPIAALVGTLVLVLIGWLVGRSRRSRPRQDQYTTTVSPVTT